MAKAKDRAFKSLYEKLQSKTAVICNDGKAESFPIEVGVHQGLALNHCLFALLMDYLTDNVRRSAPWSKVFTDDRVS